jgi:maltose alpha-D-glucosyltransferase/alpha-amylase
MQIQAAEAQIPEVAKPPIPLWFKEAVIYQLHIKTFSDANNDGIGDFQGLLSKLTT